MMKKLKRIADILSRLFVRLAHVFEHLTCDDVPHVDFHYDEEFYGSDDDEEDVL